MIPEVCWNGRWTLSFGLSQFHGHGPWLMCEVALGGTPLDPSFTNWVFRDTHDLGPGPHQLLLHVLNLHLFVVAGTYKATLP
jgi:hypothetical protein